MIFIRLKIEYHFELQIRIITVSNKKEIKKYEQKKIKPV